MKLIKKLSKRLTDPAYSYEERTYIMLAIIGFSSMLIAVIYDIIGGEHPVEIITIIAGIICIPVIVSVTVYLNKVKTGSIILVCVLVFVILPVTFFCGGGTRGGGIFWIIFSYMFGIFNDLFVEFRGIVL